jgi:tetratricopeptide (TPR) repeat protein
MKKYFVIVALVFLCKAQAQVFNRGTLDSLLHLLPTLKDTARIKCLNTLSSHYIVAEKEDSATYYASLAYKNALAENDSYGIATSCYNQSIIALDFDHDVVKAEKFAQEGITWLRNTVDKKGIFDLYIQFAIIAGIQSRYDESIAYTKTAYAYADKARNLNQMAAALLTFGEAYLESGEYEKSFYFFQKAYQRFLQTNDQPMISTCLFVLGELYMYTGDYLSAATYFRNGFLSQNINYIKDIKKTPVNIWYKMEFAENFAHLGQFDSAWKYFNLLKPTREAALNNRIYLTCTGECYYLQKNYSRALENFRTALIEHQKLNDRNQVMRTLIGISKAALKLDKRRLALQYARLGLNLSTSTKAIRYKRDAYQILYQLYDKWRLKDSANSYYLQYRDMNDIVLNEQTRANLAAQRFNDKIALLNKEKQLRVLELEQSAQQKRALLFSILIILLFGFIFFRNTVLKRKNETHRRERAEQALELQKAEAERSKAELRQQATELEMQALRAQMNPHFIFNCLNAINHFILNNEPETASDYLSKFSKLIRMVLHLSQKDQISLQEELDALHLYIQLEQLRFQEHFQYTISCIDCTDPEAIKLPPLLLQPFVENAIWHGLMHKSTPGELTIELTLQDNLLRCTITDNGIGRGEAATRQYLSHAPKKSLGMKITANRLQLLNEGKNEDFFFRVIDLKNANGESAGTRVIITIPVQLFENPIAKTNV